MARDANGNYSLAPGNPVLPGTVIATTWANPTMADLSAAITDSLSRTGKGGMGAVLGMGGYKIASLGAGTLGTDAPQALQVRNNTFTLLTPCSSDSTGNNYSGTSVITTAPVTGTMYMFFADKANTGAMTLSVNAGAALPVTINGVPVSPGFIAAGAVINVVYANSGWAISNTAGVVGTINSVQSNNLAAITVTNDTVNAVATLNIHANVANGLCQLGGDSKVAVGQLPFTALYYVGNWNAGPGTNPAAATVGQFYIIIGAGTLTLYRNTGGNVYTAQATTCAVGDQIVYNTIGTVSQPVGWYYIPASAAPQPASLITVTPTPTFPTATNVQLWVNQADPVINGKLNLAGGTLSGQVFQALAPSAGVSLVNKTYVDNSIAAIPASVSSFNTRTGAVSLLSADVLSALTYTPANVSGQVFTGLVQAPTLVSTGFVDTKGVRQTAVVGAAAAVVDFNAGQSQIRTLSAPLTITAVSNIPVGSILRLVFFATNNTITWPATVNWPLGTAPNLAAGPLKKAIVVIENDGAVLLATSSAF